VLNTIRFKPGVDGGAEPPESSKSIKGRSLVSDPGAHSAHGELHQPLEPRPPIGRLAAAARPMGRGQQTLPRHELHHQGPHAAVNQPHGGRTVPILIIIILIFL